MRKSAVEHVQNPGLCSLFIHSVVSNDSVSGRWRPCSDCAKWQREISLGSAQTIIRNPIAWRPTRLNVVWKSLPLIFHGSIRRVKKSYCYWWKVGEDIWARAEETICCVAYSKITADCKFWRVQSKLRMLMIFAYDHYENTPIQIYWKFYNHKRKIFR